MFSIESFVGQCREALQKGDPSDAVAGVPRDYADAVMTNTVALVATRVTVDDVVAAWGVDDEGTGG